MTETGTRPQFRLKRSVQVLLGAVAIFFVVMMIEYQLQNRKIGNIQVQINQANNYHFLDTLEVKRLLTDNGKEDLGNTVFKNVSIKTLESRVKANLFVDKCEIARNLRGDLFVEVTQALPIARFMRQGKPDFYVDSTGKIMPVLEKYAARVLLITRETDKQLPDFKKYDRELLKLINFIYHDKFFKAQITQLEINQYDEIAIYPQVGNQIIELGKIDNWEDKLKRLNVYYQRILPLKGWGAYKKINLRFNNQVICE
ncbi:MAG: cell division protein FtsQ/DivIB [Microscillaceae bacterium]|jgi:cell division protein FtsQ|nr:cell division protein FtsQ/DivIB [Microscillaceae bacterium]